MLMEGQGANGVDMNRMVEVEIPFSLGKGITSHVVTRSTRATDQQGKDSQLSGIMVFVYENNGGDPSNDKRLAYQFLNHRLLHWKEVQGGGYRMQMMQLADTSSSICLSVTYIFT